MTTLRKAAQAVLDRWDSPAWEWLKQGPTAALMTDLRAALAEEAMQRLTDVQQEIEADLSRCPKCNGPADNGHDRSIPPIPYFCTKCMEVEERAHGIGESNG